MANLFTKKSEELNKALNTIYYSLMGYIEDSAGAESEEAKTIDAAFTLVNSEACIDVHDVGMVSAIMASNMWDELYEGTPNGGMDTYDHISKWSIEFHKKFEGNVNWGEDDLTKHGFKNSACWDEAVMEFAKQKLEEIK